VAFLDLDFFKRINDDHGHDAGDKALITAVEQIHQTLRSGNMLVRWGGEEFILIMTNTDFQKAQTALERVRSAGFGTRPEGSPMTASIGVAERIGDQCVDWRAMVELADIRMYKAKNAGRDRIVAS